MRDAKIYHAKLDRVLSGYFGGSSSYSELRGDLQDLMAEVSAHGLDLLVERYGVGVMTGLLKIAPDDSVRAVLRKPYEADHGS